MSKILITGGAGYIGSHTAVELLNNGEEIDSGRKFKLCLWLKADPS